MREQTLERGLKNRHVQLIAIGGAIGTGLFLGAGKVDSFSRAIDFICLLDYRGHLFFNHACIRGTTNK